jgi:hypothetical protein
VNKDINKAYIFSLRPDIAIANSISDRAILVFDGDIDYRGIAFFCVGSMEDEKQKETAIQGLINLGCDADAVDAYLASNLLVGYGNLVQSFEYQNDSQWIQDQGLHGISIRFNQAKEIIGDRLFAYVFTGNKFSQDPVPTTKSAVGEAWQVLDIREIYQCEELYKRPVASFEEN